jgi:hypothetical protein
LVGQPEHELVRELGGVALDGFVKALGGHTIERCQISVEQYAQTAQYQDSASDGFDGHGPERLRA